MKKMLLLAVLAFGILAACNNDDNSTTTSTDVLLKKTIETDSDGTVTTTTITYNGNKISKLTYSDNSYEEVTYTGNYITSVQTFEGTTLSEEDIFEYNSSNQLSSHIYKDYSANYGEKTLYTYPAANTVNTQDFTGTLTAQTEPESTGVITTTGNNITQYAYTYAGDSNPEIVTYTYDVKNDPHKNIMGEAFLNLALGGGGVNNVLTTNDAGYISTTTYTYNGEDYPTQSIETDGFGETITTQYFYQ